MRIMPFMKRKKGIQFAGAGLDSGGGGGGSLPIASADTLGAVKVGENLTITSEGVLSAESGGGVSFADAEHEVGTYGNRKLFSRTFTSTVASSVSTADAWITASSTTSFDNIIAYYGNFIDNKINVAVTRADYEPSNGNWHVKGVNEYKYPSNGRVYLTIFYTKTGL